VPNTDREIRFVISTGSNRYRATILVVESDPSTAQFLSALLTATGYHVVLATLGHEAIEKCNTSVDLIILGLLLSDMEGLELCHYFKRSELTRNVPIMVLSEMSCRDNEKVKCFQLGADDFLSKPFVYDEILAHIEVLIQSHRVKYQENTAQKVERLREFRMILENRLVEPYFQPMYSLEPFGIFGVEVLSRPQTTGLLQNPELLFQTALEFGSYFELEIMVWEKALSVFKARGQDHNLFLNCTPHLVEEDNFMQVQEVFQRSNVNVSNVYLELTERSAISQHSVFYQRLRQYRGLGFKIAVDDVGSGYSSLESIVETRPEVVKIDRKIVGGLVTDPYKHSIVKFIVSFCHEHDIICVAEGVETKEEFQIVRNLGVKACQGYYFYRPTSKLDIPAFQSILA
jgi:EAL domain-containing protein (putative c-di-GMP-specific phosphodiesterase class I)/CheY-like chemotaxis protein